MHVDPLRLYPLIRRKKRTAHTHVTTRVDDEGGSGCDFEFTKAQSGLQAQTARPTDFTGLGPNQASWAGPKRIRGFDAHYFMSKQYSLTVLVQETRPLATYIMPGRASELRTRKQQVRTRSLDLRVGPRIMQIPPRLRASSCSPVKTRPCGAVPKRERFRSIRSVAACTCPPSIVPRPVKPPGRLIGSLIISYCTNQSTITRPRSPRVTM